MGHKGNYYQSVFLKNNVSQENRTQSMPDGLEQESDSIESCAQKSLLLDSSESNESPTKESWFNTWPERYDKVKNSPEPENHNNIESVKMNNLTSTTMTFNEALQNISLAYSPITRQLHLVEDKSHDNTDIQQALDNISIDSTTSNEKEFNKTQPHSICSTLSEKSFNSASNNLLDEDQRSVDSTLNGAVNKNGISSFFSRNVFIWKSSSESGNKLWNMFNKNNNASPIAVASSTALIQHKRPSCLPAKTKEEELRHKSEYDAMIASAKKKEQQNTLARQKREKQQLHQEEQLASNTKYFVQEVIPKWEKMKNCKKTRELWWQGLPSSIRGKVWHLAIENELNITRELYEICSQRAKDRLNSSEPILNECSSNLESSMDVIQLDISRTFPNLCIFQKGGPFSEILHSLLASYVSFRPDIGYVQGMSYIAAILILNMEQYEAFTSFSNILNQPLHLSAFTLNQTQMDAYYAAYDRIFEFNLPKLCLYFAKANLTPDLYLLDWIYTIFAKAMPLDVACRIWDVFLRDGEEFIFRTALGILLLNQDILMQMDFLHGAQFLTHLPEDLSSTQLFKSIQLISTSIGKQNFSQIVHSCLEESQNSVS